MKSVASTILFAGLAVAHSGVWSIKLDGNLYPGRDARIDDDLGAKRIEWVRGEKIKGSPWQPVGDVSLPAITCGKGATAPNLVAKVRAGAEVTVHWSGMVKMHNGPVMSYLGALPSVDTKPQDVSFFKIAEGGYDKTKSLWKNEEVIAQGNNDTFQLPSDIKPGMYVLRTELLALHSNSVTGTPQFFTHCFNLDISGDGTATPEGVKFPGGYKNDDPSVKYNLYKDQNDWDNYVAPGPRPYQGKYEAPKGQAPVVTDSERGLFPPEFQVKYDAYKARLDNYSMATSQTVNQYVPGGKGGNWNPKGFKDSMELASFYLKHGQEQAAIDKEFEDLKKEAIKMGIIRG